MWLELKDQVAVSLRVKFYVIRKCLTREVTLKLSPKTREGSQRKNHECNVMAIKK